MVDDNLLPVRGWFRDGWARQKPRDGPFVEIRGFDSEVIVSRPICRVCLEPVAVKGTSGSAICVICGSDVRLDGASSGSADDVLAQRRLFVANLERSKKDCNEAIERIDRVLVRIPRS